MRILVVGASGYIGGRLVPLLSSLGHELVLMSRDARPLAARFPDATVVAADLLEPDTLNRALEGVEVAYYLAHSMGSGERGFAERDLLAARNFAAAAGEANVHRIVYLGGLGDEATHLSTHLASRQQTGRELGAHGVLVTEFRAAIIIGSGSASFEILRHLTERLPIMITPRWVGTRCQPIGISDALEYLVGALEHPEITGIVEIGCPDILSYGDMMRTYARLRGLRRLMIPVPVLTPRLSSYWVSLVSPVPAGIARPLIEGLRNEVIVRNSRPAAAFGLEPAPYETALQSAIDRSDRHAAESTWFDSLDAPGRDELPTLSSHEGMIIERRRRLVPVSPDRLFAEVEQLGGVAGWPYGNLLWRIRGLLDRVVGGVGMRLGRRSPTELRVGDALDFWRVEALERPTLLRLRAEMRVPGRAWLQYEVSETPRGSRLEQTAFFEPKGLPGLAYWYLLYPIHGLIFRGMVRRLAERSLADAPVAVTIGEQLAGWGKVALLETRGRVSGRAVRTSVGFWQATDGALYIAAGSEDADWALNLRTEPSCAATIGERTADYRATEVEANERAAALRELILKYGTPAERLGRGPVFRLTPA